MSAGIQALTVFNKRACHIVKSSPHNKGLIVDGWFDPFWHTNLPFTDCFLVIDGKEVCLPAYGLLSMRNLWNEKFNLEVPIELYEKAGQILKFA